ncbi:MAG TPA: hypothetical protein VMV89_01065 [Candidatus Paceibacterota bacterium]|nr:hypothetical protein [Candidatus Paceibacterota bacterium]
MGFLKWFSSSRPAVHTLPLGSFTVDRHGKVMSATVGADFPASLLQDIAAEILSVFKEARTAQMPMAEVSLDFAGLQVSARDMQGGAIIFLTPKNPLATPSPAGTTP